MFYLKHVAAKERECEAIVAVVAVIGRTECRGPRDYYRIVSSVTSIEQLVGRYFESAIGFLPVVPTTLTPGGMGFRLTPDSTGLRGRIGSEIPGDCPEIS